MEATPAPSPARLSWYLAILFIPVSAFWLILGIIYYADEILVDYDRFWWLKTFRVVALWLYFDTIPLVIALGAPSLILIWAIRRVAGRNAPPELETDRW